VKVISEIEILRSYELHEDNSGEINRLINEVDSNWFDSRRFRNDILFMRYEKLLENVEEEREKMYSFF